MLVTYRHRVRVGAKRTLLAMFAGSAAHPHRGEGSVPGALHVGASLLSNAEARRSGAAPPSTYGGPGGARSRQPSPCGCGNHYHTVRVGRVDGSSVVAWALRAGGALRRLRAREHCE